MDFQPLDHAVLSARSRLLQERMKGFTPMPTKAPVQPPPEEPAPAPNNFRKTLRQGIGTALGNWWSRLTGG